MLDQNKLNAFTARYEAAIREGNGITAYGELKNQAFQAATSVVPNAQTLINACLSAIRNGETKNMSEDARDGQKLMQRMASTIRKTIKTTRKHSNVDTEKLIGTWLAHNDWLPRLSVVAHFTGVPEKKLGAMVKRWCNTNGFTEHKDPETMEWRFERKVPMIDTPKTITADDAAEIIKKLLQMLDQMKR